MLAVALSFHDNLIRIVRESIESALSEHGVIEEGDPLLDRAVAGHDC